MIEQLISTWGRILKLSSVGLEDSFFDVGGTPALAADLFREIADACGRVFPPVTIYQAPTIRALASLLADPAQSPHFPPVVPMRHGVGNPIFLAHGMGGDALQLFYLVRYIQVSNPIYGTQAQGIDGLQEPLDRIEEMADLYLDGIRRVQSQGPYVLIGYSFGGLVMMEVAQRIRSEGDKVGLLVMLDSYPHRMRLPLSQQVPLLLRSATRRVCWFGHCLPKLGNSRLASVDRKRRNSSWDLAQRIHSGELLAWERYRPRSYPGKINFVKADTPSCYPSNPTKIWANLVHEFVLETAPGDHVDMIATYYRPVADLLTRYIVQAVSENGLRSDQ